MTAIRSSVGSGSNYSNSNNSNISNNSNNSISSITANQVGKYANLATFATSLDLSAAGTPPEIEMGTTLYRAEVIEISQSIAAVIHHRHPPPCSEGDDELVSVENR
eukprot:gene16769-19887_t